MRAKREKARAGVGPFFLFKGIDILIEANKGKFK